MSIGDTTALMRRCLRSFCAHLGVLHFSWSPWDRRENAAPRCLIENAVLRSPEVLPRMGPGVKPCYKKDFSAFQRTKKSPKNTQLNTIFCIFPKNQIKYSKICLKWALKKKIKTCFSRPIIASCRSKVLQNSAMLSTFIKLPFVIKTGLCLFWFVRLRQLLL